MNLENHQEEICKYCEDFIIEGSSMSQHFICEGRFCEEANEAYLDSNEIWEDIKGFENIYQISNFGNVKSLPRFVNNGNNNVRLIKERILKPGNSGKYLIVVLCKKGHKNLTANIHQLVAIAFHNHKPDGHKIIVDHKDWNKLNNHVDNLQLITHRENDSKDQFRRKLTSQYTGVCWDKSRSKFKATITISGKTKHLGTFTNELKAAKAYQDKLKEITEE